MRNEDGSDTCYGRSYCFDVIFSTCIHILRYRSARRDEYGRQVL